LTIERSDNLKVETTETITGLGFHKFIETPDRYYINTASYDKNFSKIQSDDLGIIINKAAQFANRAYSNPINDYSGPQAKNMIGNYVVQLSREDYNQASKAVNGVVRDNFYPDIYYLILGCDKQKQLAIVDKSTEQVHFLQVGLNAWSNYNNMIGGHIEVLTQTEDYLYILYTDRTTAGYYTMGRTFHVAKIKKASSPFNVTVESRVSCYEVDTSQGTHVDWETDKAYKSHEDSDNCLVLASTINGGSVLISINKNYNTISKKVLEGIDISSTKKILFSSDSFVKNNVLHTYIYKRDPISLSDRYLYLMKIDLNTLGQSVYTKIEFEKCNIDLSHLPMLNTWTVQTYSSSGCRIVTDLVDNKLSVTLVYTVEGGLYHINNHIVTYDVADDYKTFTKRNVIQNEKKTNACHMIPYKDEEFIMVYDNGLLFYAFNKNSRQYFLKHTVSIQQMHFITRTLDGKLFAQDAYGMIHKIEPRSNVYINVWLDKERYKQSDINTNTNLNVSVEDDYGNYLNRTVKVKISRGATFEDGSTEKDIVITDNSKKTFPVVIKEIGEIKIKVR
jgi:hypothetical protein